jgi:site-specific DNA-methyltransferase (adenine-specific)
MTDSAPIPATSHIMLQGSCLHVLKDVEDNTFSSIITDPPYGYGFMGRAWDDGVPGRSCWEEFLRVAKPGAFLCAFGGPRTYHRLACSIEDAGWELRDSLMWLYLQGFPKGPDASKMIDEHLGVERPVIGTQKLGGTARKLKGGSGHGGFKVGGALDEPEYEDTTIELTAPGSDEAKQWFDWKTCLKPSYEPIILARKPLDGTLAENLLEHQAGAINVGACRLPNPKGSGPRAGEPSAEKRYTEDGSTNFAMTPGPRGGSELGLWPSNVLIDEGVDDLFDEHKPGMSRFFYCTKASQDERHFGVTSPPKPVGDGRKKSIANPYQRGKKPKANTHTTIKPIDLMRWLVRLTTPVGGIVLDGFAGSGTTGIACVLEGRDFVGIELEEEYCNIAEQRIQAWKEAMK